MSFRLETLNKGVPEETFGYFSNDTSRVRLGELPPISVYDFSRYSTDILIQAFSDAPEQTRQEMKGIVRDLSLSVSEDKVRDTSDVAHLPRNYHVISRSVIPPSPSNPNLEFRETKLPDALKDELREAMQSDNLEFKARVAENLAIALSEATAPIREYPITPFLLSENTVLISMTYAVDLLEFTVFSTYILGGGFLGWGELGIPDFVHQHIQRLNKAVSGE